MPDSAQLFVRHLLSRAVPRAFAIFLLTAAVAVSQAASIRGVVTDTAGAKITGAAVVLISGGKPVGSDVSKADGSFQILTGVEGRFFLVVSAQTFRQLETPSFYAGRLDSVERNVVLEPEWVRESIVVTATGTPTPQPQTSSTISVLGPLDLVLRDDLTSALRLMPGTFVVQTGQLGAQTSLFIRGGDSVANKILLDGVSVGDLGGQFDFGPLSTTAIERAEVYRGPDSSLYGADAASGVVSLTTPHGTTSFPSILLQADAGNLSTPPAKSLKWPERTTSSTTSAHSVGSRPPTICLWTSTTWPLRRPTSAGSSTAARRFGPRCAMASMPPAFPMHGISITSATTAKRATRISTAERPSRTRPRPASTTASNMA